MKATHQTEPYKSEVVRIRPARGWRAFDFREIWRYRELLYFLVWRDIKVRYKQTLLGAAWAILQPVLTVIVFSLFFGRLAKVPSDGLPYSLFCFTALVPWMLFAYGLNQSTASLVTNANLITKVYFPRLIIPIATVLSGLVDFLLGFVMLLGMMKYHHVAPTAHIVWLPLFLLLALASALGAGLWLSALNVQYRDVRYVVPFVVQFWMYATPIAYPSSLLNGKWRAVFGLNPMAGVVEGFRWALLGTGSGPGPMFAASLAASLALLIGGAIYFRRMEKSFADVI
jgi:lipopolysaccharide transport system permease protein